MKEYFYSKFDGVGWDWWNKLENVPEDIGKILINLNAAILSTIPANKVIFYADYKGYFTILEKARAGVDSHGRVFSFRQFLYQNKAEVNSIGELLDMLDKSVPVADTSNPDRKADISSFIDAADSKRETRKIFEILINALSDGRKVCIVNEDIPASLPKEHADHLTFLTFPAFKLLKEAFGLLPFSVAREISFMLNYEDGFIRKGNFDFQLLYCGARPLISQTRLEANSDQEELSIDFEMLRFEGYAVSYLSNFHPGKGKFASLFEVVYALKNSRKDSNFVTTLLESEAVYADLDLKEKVLRFANLILLYNQRDKEYYGNYQLFEAIGNSTYADKITLLKRHLLNVSLDEIIVHLVDYDRICRQNNLTQDTPDVLETHFHKLGFAELDSLVAQTRDPEKKKIISIAFAQSIQYRTTTWEDFVTLSNYDTLKSLIISLSRTIHLQGFASQVGNFWHDFALSDFQSVMISHLPAIRFLHELTPGNTTYPQLLLGRFKIDNDVRWLETAGEDAVTLPYGFPFESDEGFEERIEILRKVDLKDRGRPLVRNLEMQLQAYWTKTSVAREYARIEAILFPRAADRLPYSRESDEPPNSSARQFVEDGSQTDASNASGYEPSGNNLVLWLRNLYARMTNSITLRVPYGALAGCIVLFLALLYLCLSDLYTTSFQTPSPVAVATPEPDPIDSVAYTIEQVEHFLNRIYFQGDTALALETFQQRAHFKGIRFKLAKKPNETTSWLAVDKVDTLLNDVWWNRFVELCRDSVVAIRVIPADSVRMDKVTRLKIENKKL